MKNGQGMQRALSSLFSVDAWHFAFDKKGRSKFHVSLSFGMAKLGGDGVAPVSFTLQLRRAEMIAVMPMMGEFRVDPSTVDRLLPGEDSVERNSRVEQKVKGAAGVDLSVTSANGRLAASAEGEMVRSTLRSSSATERSIIVSDFKKDGHYGWELRPRAPAPAALEGPVWDANNEPRFVLMDRRTEAKRAHDAETNNPPLVKVIVKCRREDFKIEDLKVNDEEEQKWLWSRPDQAKRVAAAESFIRDCLMKEGLTAPDLSGEFIEITLADCVAEQV